MSAPDTADNDAAGESQEIVIKPNRAWLYVPWRELHDYRDLLFLLVRRDFIAAYKQTVLGPLWYVISPLLTTIVFTVIFGKVAKIPTDGMPKLLFYLCGQLAWGYFARCLNATSNTFVGNAGIFGKVYFPRLIIPLSRLISSLFGLVIQLATFLAFWVYFKWFTDAGQDISMSPGALLLPLLLIQSAAAGMGAGLWLSSLSAKYRDFMFISGFFMSLWMYATPVVYPLSIVPERWRWVSSLNPMTGVVESFRYAFLGKGIVDPRYLALSVVTSMLILITGIMMFNRTERTFIDTV